MIKDKLTSLIITFIFVTVFIFYFLLNLDDFKVLLEISLVDLLLITLIQLLVLVGNGLFLVINLRVFNFHMSSKEATRTTILTAIGNFFTPFRGGAGLRAIYLKKRYNLAYSVFLSTLAAYYIMLFLINSFIALVGLLILRQQNQQVSLVLIFSFLILSLFLTYLILSPRHVKSLITKSIPGKRFNIVNRFVAMLEKTIDGWELVSKNKPVFFRLFFLGIFNALIAVSLYYIELTALGIHINILNVIVFAAISSISLLISITPGSLGVKESLLILFQTSLGLTTSQVLSVSVLDRSVNFFLLLVLAILVKLFFNDSREVEEPANN